MKRDQRSKLETTSWLAVVRAYQECNRRYAQLLKGFDLTIPQFDPIHLMIGFSSLLAVIVLKVVGRLVVPGIDRSSHESKAQRTA